jgi:predicted restriction endonuclease
VLDAAHIISYQGDATNHVQNGLLLRTDLHTLFDLGLIAVDTDSWTLRVAPSLRHSEYWELNGRAVRRPKKAAAHPGATALDQHRSESEAD